MKLVLVLIGVLLLVGLVLLLRGSRQAPPSKRAPVPAPPPPQTLGRAPDTPAPRAEVVESPQSPVALAGFAWLQAESLSADRRAALLERLQTIRQPSRSLQQLVSPDFIANAGSAELADLVKGEPLASARILARVNSPLYGLQQPMVQLGQAITFMGLNAVRGLCIQYLLDESFKADGPQRQAALDAIWRAASRGGEIAFRLAQALRLPDPGLLATQVVLSFVGHLAAATLLPEPQLATQQGGGLLARTRREQEQLGLPAAELGRLLMQAWGLPAPLVEAACAVDALVVTPLAGSSEAASRRGLAYLAARWGEQLDGSTLAGPALGEEDAHHLERYLQLPALKRWQEFSGSQDWAQAMERLLRTTGGE